MSVFFTSLEKLSLCGSASLHVHLWLHSCYVGSFLKVCIIYLLFFYFCVYVYVDVEVLSEARRRHLISWS